MEQVDRCREEDIPSIVKLHLKVHGNPNNEALDDLESYYRHVLFDNPWHDEEIPSLVFRSKERAVEGLLGVLVRRMVYKGKPIRMAVPHNMMVAPDCRASMAAILIARKFIDGSQDLVFGDGANDQSRRLMEAMGATVTHHSMHWLCILRPGSYAGVTLGKKKRLTGLAFILRPAYVVADSIARRFLAGAARCQEAGSSAVREIDNQSLLLSIKEILKHTPLHPDYSDIDLEWMRGFLNGNSERGPVQSIEICNEKAQRIGACLYRLDARRSMDILFLWAREGAADTVFDHLLNYAMKRGVISVEGAMEPHFLQGISDHNCWIRRRSWVVVHSRDPELLNVIYRGDAILSALDGEFVATQR